MLNRIRIAIKSFCFCIKYLPFKMAIKRPIQISLNCKVHVEKGAKVIIISEKLVPNMIKIGFNGTKSVSHKTTLLWISQNGMIVFSGGAIFAEGTSIYIKDNCQMHIGKDFYCNKNCLFRCCDNISFGDKALLGWNVTLQTTDGHVIEVDRQAKDNHGPIEIGNHVWIASNSIVSKGVIVGDDCVIAQLSLVNKSFPEKHLLIAGIPAKIIKRNINRID